MAKVKRFLTEQEDRLLSSLRSLQNGSITQDAINAAVGAVKEQQGIDTVFYNRGEQSIDVFMRENFGSEAIDENSDEPSKMYLIDFQ